METIEIEQQAALNLEAPEPEIFDENEEEENIESVKMRKVYLTFDDGPSVYTGEILDILKEYDVKATFFVVGKEGEKYEELYKRIVEEGHTLGMHSYSHKYSEIYETEQN
ncbi:MAG: polysaccharide deacetylase family protein [Lachnospiraceae bacterium]|nr:polysaccharide deacetylase family protein [Lachnospiraceae bacterium]